MPQAQQRHRKVIILTPEGFEKLQAAISQTAIWNHYTKSCTLEAISEQTGLSTHTLSKIHARKKGVDLRSLVRYFKGFDLTLEPNDYMSPIQHDQTKRVVSSPPPRHGAQVIASLPQNSVVSWGLAPDVSAFYGRATELTTLQQWVLEHRCRLITLFGMGGIGKTWLATKLAEQVQHEFQSIVWRNLRPITRSHSPISFSYFLDDLIRHLAPQPNSTIPEFVGGKMRQLMDILRRKRCLLVLDQIDSVLHRRHLYIIPGKGFIEQHDADDEAYRELLKH